MKSKITTLSIQKRLDYKENKTEHIHNYDYDNIYPQRVLDIVADSRSAQGCLKIRRMFLFGGGFYNDFFAKQKVNRKGLTVDQLLRKSIRNNFDLFESFVWHINYNMLGEVVEVNPIPFDNARYSLSNNEKYTNKIAIYHDWSKVKEKTIKFSDVDFYNVYNPNIDQINSEVELLHEKDKEGNIEVNGWSKYKGQILWVTPDFWEYPLSVLDSVLEDCQTEAQLKRFKFNAVDTNFLASHIVVTNKQEDPIEAQNFADNLKTFQGSEDAGKLLWFEKENESDEFELQKVDIQNYDNLYTYTEDSVAKNIAFPFNIPDILLRASAGSLGENTAREDATDFYNGLIQTERLIIEEIFKDVFSRFHFNINPDEDYSLIPFKFPETSSKIPDSQLKYYPPDRVRFANGDTEEYPELIYRIGVDNYNLVMNVIQADKMSYEQKKATLRMMFGLSEIEIKQLLINPDGKAVSIIDKMNTLSPLLANKLLDMLDEQMKNSLLSELK
jgi:hypothetical protein